MGFARVLLPAGNLPLVDPVGGIGLVPIGTVAELAELIFP
jgi:hypothetical protein